MKSATVTLNLLPRLARTFSTLLLALLFLLVGACQKDPDVLLPAQAQATTATQVSLRSGELDAQVIQHIQWLINNMAVLVSDEAVAAAIQAGNTSAPVVTAKLQTLGYSGFEQFAQAFNNNGSAVQAALRSGTLTQAQLLQITAGHTFDFSNVPGVSNPEGRSLPCVEQFRNEIRLTPLIVAAAAIGTESPWAGAIAGVVHVYIAYRNYKDCLEITYPGTNIP